MYVVALTGLIGSGKSTVAKLFRDHGIATIDTDHIAKELTQRQEIIDSIKEHFGQSIITSNGQINRKDLRNMVFANPAEKIWLERLLHPMIRTETTYRVQMATSPYVIIEIPLLKDKANYPLCNTVLNVVADAQIRKQRIQIRSNLSIPEIDAIFKAQQPLESLTLFDHLLNNDGSLESLRAKVKALHLQFSQEAHQHAP